MQFGSSISRFLQSIGFTRNACFFALKSRHQPLLEGGGYKKLSWHLTLLAFAPYTEWRKAMHYTEKNGYSADIKMHIKQKDAYMNGTSPTPKLSIDDGWQAALLADSHILANSKGQYLQTLLSEKVEAGTPATGIRFQFEGVYNSSGILQREILRAGSSEAELMAYVVTSMSMQDPWSIVSEKRFKDFADEEKPTETKRKRKEKREEIETPPPKKSQKEHDDGALALNHWDLLPKSEVKWMRGLLEVPGASFLTILPCIKDEKIMPTEVFNIINTGRGKIIFYANVVHVVLCPRYLVNGNLIHRHHNDSAVAICISENIGGGGVAHRLFVRCFSEKCLQHCRRSQYKQIPSKWEEYLPSHFVRYTRLLLAEKREGQNKPATMPEAT